ncbi:hypothetical protein KSP40_PGU004791 [Platanthera guangdongensis]|uniref:Uncharacterized protein n=1 Tax=Platanthera guangdongensis TaxID=2320717 RepID=A0ABR2MXT9_9ASPA
MNANGLHSSVQWKQQEVKNRPLPIVLAAFSGGSKGCLYKLLQLVDGKCEGQILQDGYGLVKLCLSGQMYDSSPVDFTSDLGTRFVLQPSVLGLSRPPRLVAWMAKAFSSTLDALFINRFEAERAEYWQTLYSFASMGPFLIFCSEDDELAPYKIVSGFAQQLRELGGDVNLMVWSSSPHVAHYRYHKAEYKTAVAEFITKASLKYSRTQQLCRACCVPESASNLHGSTGIFNNSPRISAMGSSEDFFLQTSMEYDGTMDPCSLIDEHNKGQILQLPSNIKPQGVLSQVLGNVCVPKNIEDRDINPTSSSGTSHNFSSSNITFWGDKFIKRSRL